MPFPGAPGRYPPWDEVVAYLTDYAIKFQLLVQLGARVVGVEKAGAGFLVFLAEGHALTGGAVIAATGSFEHPHAPDLPNADSFGGELLHSTLTAAPLAMRAVAWSWLGLATRPYRSPSSWPRSPM